MKYNAVNHTIETDAGEFRARLTGEVSAETGFAIADAWSELGQPTADEIEYEALLAKAEDERDGLWLDVERLKEAMEKVDVLLANAQCDLRGLCGWLVADGQNPDRDSVLEECQGVLNTLEEIGQTLKVN